MKKVTIITPPEYESILLESLGKASITQLKEVSDPEFDNLRKGEEKIENYGALFNELQTRYQKLVELIGEDFKPSSVIVEDLKRFSLNPREEVEHSINELNHLIAQFKEVKDSYDRETKLIIEELQKAVEEQTSALEKEKQDILGEKTRLAERYEGLKARLESVRALEPEQLKSCFAAGVAKKESTERLQEYLARNPDIFSKTVEISSNENIIFVFGSEKGKKWVDALFLVFEVKDIFDVLNPSDILLVLDPEKRRETIKKYQEELNRLKEEQARKEADKALYSKIDEFDEEILHLEEEHKRAIEKLKQSYDEQLKKTEAKYNEKLDELKEHQSKVLSRISYMHEILRILSNPQAIVLRTKVISILQGWVPEYNIPTLQKIIIEVESKIGEKLFVQFEDISHEDHNVPTPPPDIKPKFLKPAWTLTTLRGWPSAREVNPAYISIFFFSFQFGLMFGDIGQGAILLVLGLILTQKYNRGMMSKLGTLFIPMGISAILFGVLYNSFFLIEEFLPYHAIMPNPVEKTTRLMFLVFQIAVIEMIVGLALGAINELRSGHKWGAIGEHGLGMILYIIGLYLSAYAFIVDSKSPVYGNFMGVLSYWTFYIMLSGLILSMIEPIIASISHGRFGMEVFGQGIGGLLMTFVEGLANLFSFLRIAAFSLAHASLALAAHIMSHGILGAGGLVIMNVIAMTFELISSSVQSLRLLYYEFMGKFFHGGGVPFRPFTIRRQK
ncbi:hypothetical protein KEJ21_06505 [Candidatus Bathyarchaeota archaeon]|nr:hypothetical protein [Candidatus Bathyarchaeota archaeon]MBS7630363.1 hypothetical protein [Candidatus Bathyarchaeota archaeon]